jgi:hypothetical protein
MSSPPSPAGSLKASTRRSRKIQRCCSVGWYDARFGEIAVRRRRGTDSRSRRESREARGPAADTRRTPYGWQLRRVAVMNSRLTVIDPAAPRRRNPITIGANGDELWCGRGGDLDDWTRTGVANVLMALGEAGCRYRHASHARKGNRHSGERRTGHDISKPKVNMCSYHASFDSTGLVMWVTGLANCCSATKARQGIPLRFLKRVYVIARAAPTHAALPRQLLTRAARFVARSDVAFEGVNQLIVQRRRDFHSESRRIPAARPAASRK